MIFPCVGAKNQILDYKTYEEYLLGVILVVNLEATGLWYNRSLSSKPTVFLRRQDYDGAPVRKDLSQLLCGSPLEGFYFGVSWRSPTYHIIILMKVKILSLLHANFVLIDFGKMILRFGFGSFYMLKL